MEQGHRDFPTGSSGGGGKKGYGVRTSLFISLNADENAASISGQSNEANNLVFNGYMNGNEKLVVNWSNEDGSEAESFHINSQAEDKFMASTSGLAQQQHYNGLSSGFENVGLDTQKKGIGVCIGFSSYYGCSNIHNNCAYHGIVGAQVQGPGGVGFGLNGNSSINYSAHPEAVFGIGNGGNQDGGQGAFNGVRQGGGHVGEFGALYEASQSHSFFSNNTISYSDLFYYITTTDFAHRIENGSIMSQFLCLRDPHILGLLHVRDYSGLVNQLCHSPDLAEAIISHIECVKALWVRNVRLGLSKQITCANAIMRLLGHQYRTGQIWTFGVVGTVMYDLTVLSQKSATSSFCRKVIIKCDWAANRVVCLFHPAHCRCHSERMYPTRKFYRRH